MKKTIVYLCYGQSRSIAEAIFSILSIFQHVDDNRRDFDIVVYTDHPEAFAGLPIVIEKLTEARLQEWVGPHDYVHRRKTMTMIDAFERYSGPIIFVDSDTWFIRSPKSIFERIKPGTSCLHLAEGRLAEVCDGYGYDELASFLEKTKLFDSKNVELQVSSNQIVWNSGVIGLHPADSNLLIETLHLIDQVWSQFKTVHTIEQFALGYFLEKHTRVRTVDDIVFHYWMSNLRLPFQNMLPSLLSGMEGLSIADRALRVYAYRPRPRLRRRFKLAVVHRFQDFGLFGHRMRASG